MISRRSNSSKPSSWILDTPKLTTGWVLCTREYIYEYRENSYNVMRMRWKPTIRRCRSIIATLKPWTTRASPCSTWDATRRRFRFCNRYRNHHAAIESQTRSEESIHLEQSGIKFILPKTLRWSQQDIWSSLVAERFILGTHRQQSQCIDRTRQSCWGQQVASESPKDWVECLHIQCLGNHSPKIQKDSRILDLLWSSLVTDASILRVFE